MCFVQKNRLDNLDFTSIKTIFLRYSIQQKNYKCYDPKSIFFISRDVIFFEHNSFTPMLKKDQNDQILSNEFVLPCYTNQERRKVVVENHIRYSRS
jgi:hypothetical protein